MKKHNSELNYFRIKELRQESNLSQQFMADLLGIKKPTYTQFETMRRELFPITKLNELANYFNVSLDYLLNLSNTKEINILNKDLDPTVIGKRLKEIRLENKYYQDTLANEVGVTAALISEYEKGKRLVSLPFGFYVCKKFNVSMDWLYGKVDYPKNFIHN